MRYAKLAVVVVIICSVLVWVRRSVDFGHIARSLPFSSGHRPGIYDVGAIVIILLVLWGLSRLRSTGERSKEADDLSDDLYEDFDDEYEPDEDDEDEDG